MILTSTLGGILLTVCCRDACTFSHMPCRLITLRSGNRVCFVSRVDQPTTSKKSSSCLSLWNSRRDGIYNIYRENESQLPFARLSFHHKTLLVWDVLLLFTSIFAYHVDIDVLQLIDDQYHGATNS